MAEMLQIAGAFALGAIFGSFLNALSFRFNTGRSVMHGRSRCMCCGHALRALDLVPLFSFIFLRGRCRYCHSRLSWQYPLVELVAGLLSLAIFLNFSDPVQYALWLAVWMILLFVVVYDIKHTIIPLSCSVLLGVLALAHIFISAPASFSLSDLAWALLAGPLLALPLFLLSLVTGGTWMGWGDSMLELSLGWLLGLTAGLTALMLGFWSGALVGMCLILLKRFTPKFRGFTMKSEMPFAPFLILGAAIALFLHVDFFSSLTLLF